MASIEFAFVAEFAKIELNGTITAVGAGVRGVGVTREQPIFVIYLAGCVNRQLGEDAVDLNVMTDSPESLFSMVQTIELAPMEGGDGDFATTVFAARQEVPLAGEGKYTIALTVGDGNGPGKSTEVDIWVKFSEPHNIAPVS